MSVVIIIVLWIFLMLIGLPVAHSLLLLCLSFMIFSGYGLSTIASMIIDYINSFPLLAIPLFILSASILNSTQVTKRLFDFSSALVGHLPGGLGYVNVLASVFFSGMSGSAIADAGGLGRIEIEAMRKAGYDDDFSGSITAASSIIGPLIPPSITMVIYGVMSTTSIAQLFLGGIIPGLLCAFFLMAKVYIIAKKRCYPTKKWAGWRGVVQQFSNSFFALLTPFIIILGIFGGLFSPTEAAAITVVYSLLLSIFIYRNFKLRVFWHNLEETAIITSAVMIITMAAALLTQIVVREKVSEQLTLFLLHYSTNKYIFLLLINLLFFVLGSFVPALILVLVMIPVLMPSIAHFGIDPIHFGILITLNIMIASLTPPMGVALFVVAKTGNIAFENIARSILPWLIPLFILLILVSYVPLLSTFLPSLIARVT